MSAFCERATQSQSSNAIRGRSHAFVPPCSSAEARARLAAYDGAAFMDGVIELITIARHGDPGGLGAGRDG